MEQYTPKLVAAILANLNPNQTCFDLHLCPGDVCAVRVAPPVTHASPGRAERRPARRTTARAVHDEPASQSCLMVLQTVQSFLRDNRSVGNIELVLKHVCDNLPSIADEVCCRRPGRVGHAVHAHART